MVYPGMPPNSPEPVERPRREFDEDDDLDISRPGHKPPAPDDLTTGDWLLCIFCSGIACIIGIIRLIQGRPGAGKMIGVAILFSVMWSLVRLLISSMSGP